MAAASQVGPQCDKYAADRDITRAECSTEKGKMMLEAFSVTHVGEDGSGPGMVAVGEKRKTLPASEG